MIDLPSDLRGRLAHEDRVDDGAGTRWLARLPAVLDRLAATWSLHLGPPFAPGGLTALVLPVTRADGSAAVLKVPVPDEEQAGEAAGLALVRGRGAVRLLGHDAASGAMLLERADPARSLHALADAEVAADAAVDLLTGWWDAAGTRRAAVPATDHLGDPVTLASIPTVASLARRDATDLRARAAALATVVDRRTLDEVHATLREVPGEQDVLLHTDLHPGNALGADRAPWLVIDPKPAWGPRAYDLQPLLRDGWPAGGPGFAAGVRRRLDRLAERAGLPGGLTRTWVRARCVVLAAWALVDAGASDLAMRDLAVAAALDGRAPGQPSG